MRDETNKGISSLERLEDVRRNLAQIAAGPEDLQRLETTVN
jgi:hypothetical protein